MNSYDNSEQGKIDREKIRELLQTQAMQEIAALPKDRRLKLVRLLARQIASRAISNRQRNSKKVV